MKKVIALLIGLLFLSASCDRHESLLPENVSLSFPATDYEVTPGTVFSLEVAVSPKQYAGQLVWFSSSPEVASVSPEGVVTAHTCGYTQIEASYKTFSTGWCYVVVSEGGSHYIYYKSADNKKITPFVSYETWGHRAGIISNTYSDGWWKLEFDTPAFMVPGAAFYDTRLTDIILPDCMTIIADGAFYSTELESITLPSSVKRIGENAFREFYNRLQEVIILAQEPPYLHYPIFDRSSNCRILVPAESVDTYKAAVPKYADRIWPISD